MICCLALFIASDWSNPLATLEMSFASVFENTLAVFGTIYGKSLFQCNGGCLGPVLLSCSRPYDALRAFVSMQ